MFWEGPRRAMTATQRSKAREPNARAGNGRGLTKPQEMLSSALGWETEVSIRTGQKRGSGYPHAYKVDIANRELMIAIEVDGPSHAPITRQIADRKRDELLAGLGWLVLRFTNERVLTDLQGCLSEISSSISKSRSTTTT